MGLNIKKSTFVALLEEEYQWEYCKVHYFQYRIVAFGQIFLMPKKIVVISAIILLRLRLGMELLALILR